MFGNFFQNHNPIQSIQNFLGNRFRPQQPQQQARPLQFNPRPNTPVNNLQPNFSASLANQSAQMQQPRLISPVPSGQTLPQAGGTYRGQGSPQPQAPMGPPSRPTQQQSNNGGQSQSYSQPGMGPPGPPAGYQAPVDPAQEAAAMLQKTGQQLMSDLATAYTSGQIDPSKPFALDEFLARKAATQAISPYYAQVNQRFQQGIRNLMQSGQMTAQRGLQGIAQTGETQQNKLLRLLQSGQQSAGEQYSGQGLYDSGERARAQGLMGVTTSQELSNYLGGQSRDVANVQQQQRDLLNRLYLQKQETENQLGRNQGTDVEAAVQEAQRQAATKQGVTALEGQPLTSSNMADYFNQRAKALSQFLPNQ